MRGPCITALCIAHLPTTLAAAPGAMQRGLRCEIGELPAGTNGRRKRRTHACSVASGIAAASPPLPVAPVLPEGLPAVPGRDLAP